MISTVTATQSSITTVTVTETLSPIAVSTSSVTVPVSTTSGWTIVPTTTTLPPPPTVNVPANKIFLMTDKVILPVYDQAAFQQNAKNIKFFPYSDSGVYISTNFSLNPNVYLYLNIQSDRPLDSSNLGISFNSSEGEGSTVSVNKILNGDYTSLKTNFSPSWVYAYEQTKSGNTWETKIILHAADIGSYALYLINTYGDINSISYSVYTWN